MTIAAFFDLAFQNVSLQKHFLTKLGYSENVILDMTIENAHFVLEIEDDNRIVQRMETYSLNGANLTDYKVSGEMCNFYAQYIRKNDAPKEKEKLSKEEALGIAMSLERARAEREKRRKKNGGC